MDNKTSTSDFNDTRGHHSKADTNVEKTTTTTMKHHQDEDTSSDPIHVCEILRQQNDALRQELQDIRREMDEITDQFRTEDAEEFKHLQAELEVTGKNCRILQFKLRKAEKRNEMMEVEKSELEEKIHQLTRENVRVRDLHEELLIAKEVSVRLHNELEKSEEARKIGEKFNRTLKQQIDILKESIDEKSTNESQDDYFSWQLSVGLYEALFREYILMEELTWLNSQLHQKYSNENLTDLIQSYQEKIALLNDEIRRLNDDIHQRDHELSQITKLTKQRSRSLEKISNGTTTTTTTTIDETNRIKRGVSVDGGENLREELNTMIEENRSLKSKIFKLEDQLNNFVVEKESLLLKLDEQSKQTTDETLNEDLQIFTKKIDDLIRLINETKTKETISSDLQQTLRNSRWNKSLSNETEQQSNIYHQANELLIILQDKHAILGKIRSRLTNLTFEDNETCRLLDELDATKDQLETKNRLCEQFQCQINQYEKTVAEQILTNKNLQDENQRLNTLNQKQSQDLRHAEQLRQSIIIFEKKLDQKQTRVNELSMKIIEKEDIIETKVKECQKHRLELRELETKYYTLGKQLEEQIYSMTKEIEKLNVEKEMLKFDLESLRLNQQNERPKSTAEEEIARVKSECRQQIVEGEIESLKLRLTQSNHERDELMKMVKEFEKKYKELQIKYDADEQMWSRMKKEMIEKQRKYDESIKMKSELQNAVDRLRQKLHDLEMHNQEKQNKFNLDKQQWEIQRLEFSGKINEFEEQLSKVTKRQRKDLDVLWKKERTDLQKQLQQSQQFVEDLQKQLTNREAPQHLTEKLNVLLTENELLLNKIKDLELVVDDVQLLKNEIQRLRDKNSSDWNYWRKQQSDLYAQLRQQTNLKESIFYKFERLQKQLKSSENLAAPPSSNRLVRDLSVGPLSLNSFQNEATTKTSLSNFSRETAPDEIDLPHGTIDGRTVSASEIVGTIDDSTSLSLSHQETDKQRMFDRTYSAQENTAASIEEIASKIDRVEDHLFSYRRFMDFIRAKSEKSASLARDDSFSKSLPPSSIANKRLASLPPETNSESNSNLSGRRSRFDATTGTTSHDHLPSTDDLNQTDSMSASMIAQSTGGSSKNRFFSLSRRFRFRTQSPEKSSTPSATVHFLDEDIDLETKERTTRKSEQNRPSKGILKTLRHRSPFRFRSKDAIIVEQEPSPPPAPTPAPSVSPPSTSQTPATQKEPRAKVAPAATSTKNRGRLVELKKVTPKSTSSTTSSTNGSSKTKANTNNESTAPPSGSTLLRRASGLKDLIHKFEPTSSSDRSKQGKRVTIDPNSSNSTTSPELTTTTTNDANVPKSQSFIDMPVDGSGNRTSMTKAKTIDIPDLLRNVDKETTVSSTTRGTLKHSNSSRQTTSFDSTVSMVSASDSISTTNSTTRKPTSTARPLMLSMSREE